MSKSDERKALQKGITYFIPLALYFAVVSMGFTPTNTVAAKSSDGNTATPWDRVVTVETSGSYKKSKEHLSSKDFWMAINKSTFFPSSMMPTPVFSTGDFAPSPLRATMPALEKISITCCPNIAASKSRKYDMTRTFWPANRCKSSAICVIESCRIRRGATDASSSIRSSLSDSAALIASAVFCSDICTNRCKPANALPPNFISSQTPKAIATVANTFAPSSQRDMPQTIIPMPTMASATRAQTTIFAPDESRYSSRATSSHNWDVVFSFIGPGIRSNKGFRPEWAIVGGIATGLLILLLNYWLTF